jgi:hypothetical protein
MPSIRMSDESFKYENVFEELFLIAGLIILFFGAFGLVMSILIYTILYGDQVFLLELYFVYIYMIILGTLLVLYHKKILVRGYRT